MSLQDHVQTFVTDPSSDAATDAVSSVGSAILSRSVSILDVITSIGAPLTSTDPFERAKAVRLLTKVLDIVVNTHLKHQTTILDRKTVAVLMAFYLERLHDTTSVEELIEGIRVLLSSNLVSRADAIEIPRAVFKELSVQSFSQNVRYSIYLVFDRILEIHFDAIKNLADDFISGFLVAMVINFIVVYSRLMDVQDGEKDPRNILICFGIVHTIITKLDITNKHQDIFESIYCYFPITFRPPPNDPYGITANDLKLKLRQCFAGSFLFAKLAWPVLIEKLSSSSENAKLDAMQTITACAPVYGADSLSLPHLDELWDQLVEESLDAKPAAQRDAALDAVTAITLAVSKAGVISSATGNDAFSKFLGFVSKYAITELLDTTTPKEAARKVLNAAAKASESAFYFLVVHVVKPLVESLKDGCSILNRSVKCGVFLDFLTVSCIFYKDGESMDIDEIPANPLLSLKDQLFQLFSSALAAKDDVLVMAGLQGLSQLSITVGFMSSRDTEWYFETLFGMSVNEPKPVSEVAISVLVTECSRRVKYVLSIVVPQLIEACVTLTGKNPEASANSFDCLVSLCVSAEVFCVAVPEFVKIGEVANNLVLVMHAFTALDFIFKEHAALVQKFDYIACLAVPLLKTLVTRKIENVPLCSDKCALESVSSVFSKLMRLMDRSQQETLTNIAISSFFSGDLTAIGLNETQNPSAIHQDSSIHGLSTVFAAVICNAKAEILFQDVSPFEIIKGLIDSVLNRNTPFDPYAERLCEVIASLLNKADGQTISAFLEIENRLYMIANNEVSCNIGSRLTAGILILWITRALVMKSPDEKNLGRVTSVMNLINSDDSYGRSLSANFFILAANDPSFGRGILTRDAFAKVSLLWQQKQFKHALPMLVSGFNREDSEERKSNYLLALSHLMKHVAKSVVLYEIDKLIPLLLAGLVSKNTSLVHTILEILETLLKESPGSLAGHIESFTILFLRLVGGGENQNDKCASAEVRVLSLRCLGLIPRSDIPLHVLLGLKTRVLSGLQVPLDDSRRAVRREAGNTRGKWFLLLGKK
ncbi:mms19 nucleotide excision repair [Entophlyctis sp. JEL0112]|nr:mms19 nucleotide excision repair [Entophlyctis sp. JEL0112]